MDPTKIYAPDGPIGPDSAARSTPPRSLSGLRIAVLDNGKPGAARLLGAAAELLGRRLGTEYVGVHKKGSAATPCEPDLLQSLLSHTDLALTGTAD